MRTVHFVLNGGWLVLCGAMLLVPCVHLLQAWRYSLNRYGASSGKFAVLGSLKTLCFIVAGSTVPVPYGEERREADSMAVAIQQWQRQ